MPKYFFHVGERLGGLDREGLVLATDNDAKIEAARTMGEMIKDKAGEFWDERGMSLTVTDAAGLVLFVLEISATVSAAVSQRRLGPTEV